VYDGLETTVLRLFNVFGPRQSPHSQYAAVVPKFMVRIAAGDTITIDGDGEQSRDFTYISNVVDGTIRAGFVEGVSGRIFNVASSRSATVNHLADTIGSILGKPVHKEHADSRAGDIRDSWADVTAAREALGWEPTVELEEGLRLTAESLLG
jgi:UDP-glucose 4-epimerase